MKRSSPSDLMVENKHAVCDSGPRTATQDCRVATFGALESQAMSIDQFVDHANHVLVGHQRTVRASGPIGQFALDRQPNLALQAIDLLLERLDS